LLAVQPFSTYAQTSSAAGGSSSNATASTAGTTATAGGIAIDPFGNVFVAEGNSHLIKKYNTTGGYQTSWGSTGNGPGQLLIFSSSHDIGYLNVMQ
jgi:hypothetical protein